jgi:hypothetical protein
MAVEDECGVCNGNRSDCQQVTKIFEYKRQQAVTTSSYIKVGILPKGAATFQLEKATQSTSFLAIKIKGWWICSPTIMSLFLFIPFQIDII